MSNAVAPAVESTVLGSARRRAACSKLRSALCRKQRCESVMQTELRRCFSTFDLSFFGIGNILGGAVYVITGVVVSESGPAAILSMIIAGIAALLISFSYSELASRLPKAGGAYTYTYVIVGEFVAFLVGWSVILSNVLAFSTVSKGWSATLDSMLNYTIRDSLKEFTATNIPWLPNYPDVVAFGISVLVCAIVCSGARISGHVITAMTIINLLSVVFVIIIMVIHGSPDNIVNAPGGFMPSGFGPVIIGSATAFYAFIGFDAAATASEEVENPARTIPIAMFVTIGVSTLGLVLCTFALVYFVPYKEVESTSAFTHALFKRGLYWEGMVCGVGGLVGLTASLLCSAYAMPRVIYAIAHDGLIFRTLGRIYARTQVPLIAIICSGLLIAVLALLIDFEMLADFLSLGTLVAYSIVNCDLVALRYMKPKGWMTETATFQAELHQTHVPDGGPKVAGEKVIETEDAVTLMAYQNLRKSIAITESTGFSNGVSKVSLVPDGEGVETIEVVEPAPAVDFEVGIPSETPEVFSNDRQISTLEAFHASQVLGGSSIVETGQIAVTDRIGDLKRFALRLPLPESWRKTESGTVPISGLLIFVFFSVCFSFTLVKGGAAIMNAEWWAILLLIITGLGTFLPVALMTCYQQNDYLITTFKFPLVPVLPCASVLLNFVLMVVLEGLTFLFFGVWLAIGMAIYFLYGMHNSTQKEIQVPRMSIDVTSAYGALRRPVENSERTAF